MFRKYTVSDQVTGEAVSFRAFNNFFAKREAKRIMRRKGWAGLRLRRF